MARTRVVYRCSECAAAHPQWGGRCPACAAWNTLVEDVQVARPVVADGHGAIGAVPVRLTELDAAVGRPQPSGIAELDRVLGGGFVPGSVTLLGGEPGVGKSTLLTQLLGWWPGRTLYVSAEESAQQVRLRAERLEAINPDLWLLAETSLPHVLAALDQVRPSLVVIDSIQSVVDPSFGAAPGTVAQVRGCAHRLVDEAKRRNLPVVLVGHVTKDGALAGPRVLEHVVDTVLSFEGDRHHALRLLRAVKHRFGPTSELGVFEMAGAGLVGVPDASRLFLTDRRSGVAGSAVCPTLEGHRPLLVEVQALTNGVPPGTPPRRSAQGLDAGRLALLLAVLQRRAGFGLSTHEVFASAVGGVRLTEPGADLAVCVAVVSALVDAPVPSDAVVFGEVGLAGEVRQAGHAARRLAEASRMGFRRAVVPLHTPPGEEGLEVVRVASVVEALAAMGVA